MNTSCATVRVKNKAGDGFIIINQVDLKPHHELWPEQAPDYADVVAGESASQRESQIALRLLTKLISRRIGCTPAQWDQKSPVERVEYLLKAELELDSTPQPEGEVGAQDGEQGEVGQSGEQGEVGQSGEQGGRGASWKKTRGTQS